jgi:D-alanine-D-alanine ligase-like ATP-grasp enzyme
VKKKKPGTAIVGQLFQELAPRIGARVLMEEWGVAGQITFANGRRRYFKFSSIDLNPLASSDIAKDKDFANFFMKSMGYKTIPGKTFFSDKWANEIKSPRTGEAAIEYALTIGFPLVVKPNSGSQGRAVAIVSSEKEMRRALRDVFDIDRVAIVQHVVHGRDYRVVVLDGRVISAYERVPLNVVGDGASPIIRLLEMKQKAFVDTGRDTILKLDDPRIVETLNRRGINLETVPDANVRVQCLANANLSSGGDAIDLTGKLHASVISLCVNLTRDMGLRMCGVDLMTKHDLSETLGDYYIIEINAAPGLDHYAQSGDAQRQVVEDLYLEVLKGMET